VPTYQYSCTSCGAALEVQQSFSDEALTVCPECQGRLRKVFSAVGVVFKGSGFYRTDSRTAPSDGDGASTSSSDSGKSDSSTSGSGKSDAGKSTGASGSNGGSSGGSSGGSNGSSGAKEAAKAGSPA
jgi:putative FmdB family regulatory protein